MTQAVQALCRSAIGEIEPRDVRLAVIVRKGSNRADSKRAENRQSRDRRETSAVSLPALSTTCPRSGNRASTTWALVSR
jgi:hypothetical protein